MAELEKPSTDHNGKPYPPAQLLVLERAKLTRFRVMRDGMSLVVSSFIYDLSLMEDGSGELRATGFAD
jgi:hypothetical protein